MKRDLLVRGESGTLHIDATRARYEREGVSMEADFELCPTEPGLYWVRLGNRSFQVMRSPSGHVVVDGQRIEIEVYDPRNFRSGGKLGSADGPQEVAAPMPGKVVRVLVAAGDAVEAGQGVVVVEAMKMQNEVKSPKAGTIREIRTRADATVAAGEILLVIE
jgi:biotin carboxyl carrier protein